MLFAEPLKLEPALVTSPVAVPIVLEFCKVVAVPALPDTVVWSPVLFPLTVVVPATARVGVEEPDIATVLYFHAVISPVVSAIVTAEFWIILPVVPSKRATALSVEEPGQVTSQEPLAVEAIVTVPALPVPPVVKVILAPSMSWTLPPLAERVTV